MAKEKSKGGGMPAFKMGHWEKVEEPSKPANGKYANSEMGNDKELKKNEDALASYAEAKKMNY